MAGWIRHSGLGVPADDAAAAKWYQAGCDAGEKLACLSVATLQAQGTGVPKDEVRALATFERLCTDGVLESCTEWAAFLASRPADRPRAREIATKACDGGQTKACELLKALTKAPFRW